MQESYELVVFNLSGIQIKGIRENLKDSHEKNKVGEDLRQHMYMRRFLRKKMARETAPLKLHFLLVGLLVTLVDMRGFKWVIESH